MKRKRQLGMLRSVAAKNALTSPGSVLCSSAFGFQASEYSSSSQTPPVEAVPNAFSPYWRDSSEQ
jgi:hypothetical protein